MKTNVKILIKEYVLMLYAANRSGWAAYNMHYSMWTEGPLHTASLYSPSGWNLDRLVVSSITRN
jgi:hypothetical protein